MKAIKNKTRILKFFSASLALVMLLASLPTVIFAESTSLGSMSADSNASLSGSEAFLEDESMRDKFSKHYVLEDGSRFAVVFPEAVHYDDGNEWKEVDNRLTYNSKTGKYVSANPMFTTAFADNAASGELVSISDGEYTVSWSISFNKTVGNELVQVAASNSAASVQNGADVAEKLSEAKRLQASRGDAASVAAVGTSTDTSPESVYKNTVTDLGKALSGISYENALDGAVSLRYSVMHQKIEEDIILRSKSDFTSYTLTVNTGGLTVIAEDDGSVTFRNASGEAVFTIDAPWMQDSAYGFSKDIAVTVAQTGNTATITYTPSAEWLAAEDREYPVLIDPTFTTSDYSSSFDDTNILSGERNYIYRDDYVDLYAGLSPIGEWYTYIKLSNIPSFGGRSISISEGELVMYTTSSLNYPLHLNLTKSEWLNQSNIPQPETERILSNVTSIEETAGVFKYSFDLTSFFNSTFDNYIDDAYYFRESHHGFMIEGASDDSDTVTTLRSSESTTFAPIITLVYDYVSDKMLPDMSVYNLKSALSSKYVTVHEGMDYVGTAIYQFTNSSTIDQLFRIDYVENGEYYKIGAMCSSNGNDKLVGFPYSSAVSGASEYNSVDVTLHADSESNNVKWLIEPVEGTDDLYKIISKADPNLALMVNGKSDGSPYETGANGIGNVIVSEYTGEDNQHWIIESGGVQMNHSLDISECTTDKININESISYNCGVTTLGGTVTWSSANTQIATVAAGEVTVQNAGAVTLTADVKNSSGTILTTYSVSLEIILPVSGYEIPYEPELWNGTPFQPFSNCYNYALNKKNMESYGIFALMDPGKRTPNYELPKSKMKKDYLIEIICDDAEYFGFVFESVEKDEMCSPGTYKVALAVYEETDYHWYRQNPDGTWSHKRGQGKVTNLDASDNLIYDPEMCNRNDGTYDYSIFCGYFQVSPLG